MGILSGNPKDEPMHYGEIYSVWQLSALAKGSVSFYQACLNHAGDKELKKYWMILLIKLNWKSKNATQCLLIMGLPQLLFCLKDPCET